MNDSFMVLGPKHALASFEQDAIQAGLEVTRSQQTNFSTAPQNLVEALHLVTSKEGIEIASAVATLITAYLKLNLLRKVKVVKTSDGISVEARGYDEKELARLLKDCNELIVYEPKTKADTDHNDKEKT